VVAGGGKPDFVVRMFPPAVTGNGTAEQLPLIMIEATEGDQISAARTVELAAAQADPVLRNLQQQAGVPEDQMVKPLTVSPPMTVPGVPSRKRTTAAILGAGLGLAILAGVGADLSIIRRQERKRGRQGSDLRISDRTHSETEGYETKEHPRSADPASKVTTTSALRHE
jgi:hypothetical protein